MSVCQSHFQREMLLNGFRDSRYVCSHANEWNDAKKALKLLTLLEGEALAVWIELTDGLCYHKEEDNRCDNAHEICFVSGLS